MRFAKAFHRRVLLLPALIPLALGAPPAGAQILVSTNSTWAYLKGLNEASTPISAWREADFDISTWNSGAAPFYYDAQGLYSGGTQLNDMRNNYTSVYLRQSFDLTGVEEIGTLTLRYLCDDGFVLWINGILVTAVNKSGNDLRFNAVANSAASEPLTWLGTSLSNPQSFLRDGINHVAVQAFNVSRTSSDFVFTMELIAHPRDTNPPRISRIEPPPGTVNRLDTITLTFSEPVQGLGFSDLLINGRPANGISGSGDTYTFAFVQPTPGDVQVAWDAGALVTDFADPPNLLEITGPDASWSYTLVDATPPAVSQVTPPAGSTVRQLQRIEVLFTEPVTGLEAADLIINGQPATAVSGTGPGPYLFEFDATEPGAVSVAWAPAHGIRDLAATPNPFEGAPWTYTVDPSFTTPRVRISEFLTGYSGDNGGLMDEDDELQDWIELHNLGETPVNLQGWSLTDDPEQPGQWVFPAAVIEPGGFLIVFASGKDRRAPGSSLHTNFKLGGEGEYLALFNAESPRSMVSEFAPEYPEQRNDISFGYDPTDELRYFAQPTPGASNGVSTISGVVPPVAFNVERGLFNHPFELHLTCPLEGAQIRFTTDGSEPGATSGEVFTEPLNISTTAIIRAAAFKSNHLASASVTHSYIFPADAARQPANPPGLPATWIDTQNRTWQADYEMDPEIVNSPEYRDRIWNALTSLPVISLVAHPRDLFNNSNGIYPKSQARGPAWERPASAEFIYLNGGQDAQVNCGVQMQGNSVRDPVKTAKHSFRLVFKKDYGPGKFNHRIFPDSPVDEFDTVTLRADFNNSWMHWNGAQRLRGQRVRDAWTKESQRAMGGLAAHSRFYHLYVNGLYWGVYDATERPDASFAASYLGGVKEDYDVVNEGELVDGNMAAYNTMRNMADLSSNAAYEQVKQYLDVTAYIDYILLHFYIGHEDWFTDKNWYAIRRRAPGEGFRYLSWDGELVLNSPTVNIVTRDDQPSLLHTKLRANAQYRLDFADRVQRHFFNGGALTPEATAARYARWADHVREAMVAESARWGDYRRDVHQYSSGPYLLYTPNDHFEPERRRLLEEYFPVRTGVVLQQLKNAGLYPSNPAAPVITPHGGRLAPNSEVTLSAPEGTIYYTLDGTDPRVIYSGAVAPGAQVYSEPIIPGSSVILRARARSGADWSALSEATFEVNTPGIPLRITEIHYHPADGDPYEFIELHNEGPTPIQTGGFWFEGINYIFPPGSVIAPGARIVLASALSPSAFAQRYPGLPVFGYFDGSLSNAGERLALHAADGSTIESVNYDDENGWPAAADGEGPSLERMDTSLDPDAPAAWRASPSRDGTPGAPPTPDSPSSVRINELMASSTESADWVELCNYGSEPVDLGGWGLTDNSEPFRFTFPPGTTIEPGGFVVIQCGAPSNATGLNAPFALGRSGETISLHNAQGARLDVVSFGEQVPDLTLGRVGEELEWVLCQPTPGMPNTPQPLAEATSLRINEWLADPPPGADDWIEIYNTDPVLPASVRGLALATDAAFHQIRAISFVPAGGYLLLIADEDPGADHLDFRLPAGNGSITLYGEDQSVLDRVDYSPQPEGVSEGRLPDGADEIVAFAGTISPGAANHRGTYSGPRLNEILAWNTMPLPEADGAPAGWVELFNPGDEPFDLSGMRIGVEQVGQGQWIFPSGVTVAPGAFLIVVFDRALPPSASAAPVLSTGLSLGRQSGQVYLLASSGAVVDSLAFGFQATDLPLARGEEGWYLAEAPTPGASNAAPAELGSPADLRLNEWLTSSLSGSDWVEIFNRGERPVAMAGLTLTDNPSLAGMGKYRFPPLSFIGPGGFLRVEADDETQLGAHHAAFRLEAAGEALLLAGQDGAVLDAVYFGALASDVSQGRLPDGADGPFALFDSPTPGLSNAIVINRPPQIAPIADQTVTAGDTLVVTCVASDPDVPAQKLTFHLGVAPDGAAIDPATGIFTWRPSMAQAGAHEVEVRVSDNGEPAAEAAVRFSVMVHNPTQPRVEQVHLTGDLLRLRTTGQSGPEYLLQVSTNLVTWETVASTNPPALPFDWDVRIDAGKPFQFLRVLLAP